MHVVVAAAIETVYPRFVNERAGEIVDHLIKAGSFADCQKLVRYLTLAGKRALETAAFDEARRNFRAALTHQGALEAGERAELLRSLAMAELGLEQWDAALADFREVLGIYTNLGDSEMIGSSFAELGDALIGVGRLSEASEIARRGLAYLGADISANRLRLLAILGQASAASEDG